MKTLKAIISCCLIYSTAFSFVEDGKDLFAINCKYCHSIGNGTVVGPDLKNVEKKYSEADLIKWIKSSQSVIKSGDKTGNGLFEQFNEIIMPDQALSDAKIKSVIAYIKTQSENPAVTASTVSQQAPTATPKQSALTVILSTFKYYLIAIAIFFLTIICVLVRVINRLSKALSEEYEKNKSKHGAGQET